MLSVGLTALLSPNRAEKTSRRPRSSVAECDVAVLLDFAGIPQRARSPGLATVSDGGLAGLYTMVAC